MLAGIPRARWIRGTRAHLGCGRPADRTRLWACHMSSLPYREIAKSAWAVTKIILDPHLPITPTMTVVAASQRTSVGIAIYGNSITLTPGTVTVGQRGSELTVHALTRSGALHLEAGAMDRRVTRLEGLV